MCIASSQNLLNYIENLENSLKIHNKNIWKLLVLLLLRHKVHNTDYVSSISSVMKLLCKSEVPTEHESKELTLTKQLIRENLHG